jgi:hypothetical protein
MKFISKYKPIVCAFKNYNLNPREKERQARALESEVQIPIQFQICILNFFVQEMSVCKTHSDISHLQN